MSNDRPSDVLGALPRRRPQRRSKKRAGAPALGEPSAAPTATAAPARRTKPAARSKPGPATSAPADAKPRSATSPRAGAKPRAATAARAKAKPSSTADVRPQTPAPSPLPHAPRRRTERLRQPAQPAGVPTTPRARAPEQAGTRHILGTAAQAAAELAEIGLSASARAVRNAVRRLGGS